MQGDFSRLTFDPTKRFSRVLMQQGRVQLDADWNEQVEIMVHAQRALARDLIGPYAGVGTSFKISPGLDDASAATADLLVAPGHYYVDGILCENDEPGSGYAHQNGYPIPDADGLSKLSTRNPTGKLLVYLDVWERHIASDEDDDIREVALGGPDTATRTRVVWQVKVTDRGPDGNQLPAGAPAGTWSSWVTDEARWLDWVKRLQPTNRGELRAQARKNDGKDTHPCVTAPASRYRGQENQLYRIEIIKSGLSGAARFVWSRDNGAVTYPIRRVAGKEVTLEHLGRDRHHGLKRNDWVEVVDDRSVLEGSERSLFQVEDVDELDMKVSLRSAPGDTPGTMTDIRPLLRRWDHQVSDAAENALPVIEAEPSADWVTLEDGVQVQFQKASSGASHEYRAGDYWLVPARYATGDVYWPSERNGLGETVRRALRPRGVEHHFAPLAVIGLDGAGKPTIPTGGDCRRQLIELWKAPS